MPSVGNTPQFRALLWTNIEKILDLLYTYVAATVQSDPSAGEEEGSHHARELY